MSRAVAISTTGHPHRMRFLETAVAHWSTAMGHGDSLFVTVDGSVEDTLRVAAAVRRHTESVFRVGQPEMPTGGRRNGKTYAAERILGIERMGVAVNKNTGLELMMDQSDADHFFLSDDDCWPLYAKSLDKHVEFDSPHSMVCWGASRGVPQEFFPGAQWSWPRGVMLYVHRSVVDQVGGMDERFGAGGHEHAEYSQRIFNAGFTHTPFISPTSYATRNWMGAKALWHCEDMRLSGESPQNFASRKKANTTIVREARDWERIHAVMAEREGSSAYVGFRATDNGRAWATLCSNLTSRGAEGQA
jgi:hypothetical protein